MIILGGWGAWVTLIGVAVSFAGMNAVFGEDPTRLTNLATGCIGVIVGLFGQFLHNEDVATVVDPVTGTVETVRNRHHILWISIRWWGLLLAMGGFYGVIAG